VGLRELKNRLSEYIRQVRAGHGFAATDRGETVAELLPPRSMTAKPRARSRLADLVQRRVPSTSSALVAFAAVSDLALLSLDHRIRAAGRRLGLPLVPA
jgi:prevent-host-death family protein